MIVKDFVTLLSALLTPVIAVTTTCIAVFQYRMARNKWRLDMFDRRYPIYDHTMKYIASIIREGRIKDELLFSFSFDTKDAQFLFGDEISDFLRELYLNGIKLKTHSEQMEPLPIGEERNKHAQAIHDLLIYFGDQFDITKKLFSAYIKIHEK